MVFEVGEKKKKFLEANRGGPAIVLKKTYLFPIKRGEKNQKVEGVKRSFPFTERMREASCQRYASKRKKKT